MTVLCLTFGAGLCIADDKALSDKDREFLGEVLKKGVPDPAGSTFVRFKMPIRSVHGGQSEVDMVGWLAKSEKDQPAAILLPWGGRWPVPEKYDKADFPVNARQLLSPATASTPMTKHEKSDVFDLLRERVRSPYPPATLACAVWAWKTGDNTLAARLLDLARGSGTNDDAMRAFHPFTDATYLAAVHAYMLRVDQEALVHLEQYARFSPANEKTPGVFKELLDELRRRQKLGTFAKERPSLPEELPTWAIEKQISFLIEALDEVDARQRMQPGDVDFSSDPTVLALIRCGDAAIPALIDCIEKDSRLTRSVHYWRDYEPSRGILSVRDAALYAAESILRESFFRPDSTGDDFTLHGNEGGKIVAERIRTYWKAYGKMPFPERMMKFLTDDKADPAVVRRAAANLADMPQGAVAVDRIKDPTIAQAMLAAMDRAMAKAEPGDAASVRQDFLGYVVKLGDKRIAPEFAKRAAQAAGLSPRLDYAAAVNRLGDPSPINNLAEDFRSGKLQVGGEIGKVLDALARAGTKPADTALWAATEKSHPLFETAKAYVLSRGEYLPLHPFCLRFLRLGLGDETPTKTTYTYEKGRLTEREDEETRTVFTGLPADLEGLPMKKGSVIGRHCDKIALTINRVVVGLPLCHPSLADQDERLAKLKADLDRYLHVMRLATEKESDAGPLDDNPVFIPDIKPLGRLATADDVAKARAVFFLGNGTKLVAMNLPATCEIKKEREEWDRVHGSQSGPFGPSGPPTYTIVQAEQDANGRIWYGLVGGHAIVKKTAEEVNVWADKSEGNTTAPASPKASR